MKILASSFFLSTFSHDINLVKYLVQNLTASEAAFLTSSATSQPGPSPVCTVTAPLPADAIVYSGEVPAVTVGGDGLAPGPLEPMEVEVGSCTGSSKTGSTVSLLEQAVSGGGDAGPDPVPLDPEEVEVGSGNVFSKQAK